MIRASGPDHPLGPLGMAKIERKNDSWRKPAQSRSRFLNRSARAHKRVRMSKETAPAQGGQAEAVPDRSAPRRMAHPTVPSVLFGQWFPVFPAGGAWPVST